MGCIIWKDVKEEDKKGDDTLEQSWSFGIREKQKEHKVNKSHTPLSFVYMALWPVTGKATPRKHSGLL